MDLQRRTVLALAAGALAAPAIRPAAAAGEAIAVGAVVPMTGPLSLTGTQYLNALRMAETDIQAAGGIGGRPLKITIEDAGASNSSAVSALVRLVQELQPPFVFLSSYSTQNLASKPEVAKAAIPVMYAGGADALTDPPSPLMFRIRPADSLAALAMVRFSVDTLKARKPGIIAIQNDFGQGGAQAATKVLAAQGITPVASEAYGQNDRDFSAQLLRLRERGADVVLTFSYPADAALLLRQIKMLGLRMPVVASSAAFVPGALQLVGPADLEGVWGVVDAFVSPDAGGRMAEYARRYKARFGIDADPYGLAYYDGATLLADGLRKVGPDPKALRDWIAAVKGWKGIGHTYTFDSKGDGVHDVAVVRAKPGTKDLELVQTVSQG